MSPAPRCALHPELPADAPCHRCLHPFCAQCLSDWGDVRLCPRCRRARLGRRLRVAAVVALMVAAPAAGIAWGLWHRVAGETAPAAKTTRGTAGDDRGGAARDVAARSRRLRRARELLKAGRVAQGREILQRVLARHPDHPGALLLLARLARQQRRPREVLRLTTRLLQRAPGAQTARLWQAEAHQRLGHTGRAEATLREGLRVSPRAARLALALADRLARQRRLREAVELLHGVLQRGPDAQRARLHETLVRLEARLPARPRRPGP